MTVPTTLSDSNPTPGQFIETYFAQGPSTGATSVYSILLLANKSAAGAADDGYTIYGPDTLTPLNSEAGMVTLAGPGSEAHRMYRAALSAYPNAPIYFVNVKESTGDKATGTVVISGTATANSTFRVWVGDEFVDVGVVTADTPTIVGAALAVAVNAKAHFPVTAANVSGTVTFTAKCKGLRGNDIGLTAKFLVACGLSTTSGSPTKLSGGTVADDNEIALATINGSRFYRIVSAQNDATNLGALISQVETQAGAQYGITQRVYAGTNASSLANTISLATGLNHARATLVFQCEGDKAGGEVAAHLAAGIAFKEANFTTKSLNLDNFGNTSDTANLWKVKAPLSGRRLTANEVISCLLNGITPVNNTSSGANTQVVSVITSKSLEGASNDYRVRDHHIPSVADRFQDDLAAAYRAQLSNKLVADDPLPGEATPADTVTPTVLKNVIVSLVREYANQGLLKNRDEIIASVETEHTSPATRVSGRLQLQVVDICHQVVTRIDETGGGA